MTLNLVGGKILVIVRKCIEKDTLLKDEVVEACFKLSNPCTCRCHLHHILKQDVNVKNVHILFRPVLHQKYNMVKDGGEGGRTDQLFRHVLLRRAELVSVEEHGVAVFGGGDQHAPIFACLHVCNRLPMVRAHLELLASLHIPLDKITIVIPAPHSRRDLRIGCHQRFESYYILFEYLKVKVVDFYSILGHLWSSSEQKSS